jgi:hypothetical protein
MLAAARRHDEAAIAFAKHAEQAAWTRSVLLAFGGILWNAWAAARASRTTAAMVTTPPTPSCRPL